MSDRALPPLDLAAVQERIRGHLALTPDPFAWPVAERLVLQLAAEVARLQRLCGHKANGTHSPRPRPLVQATGDACTNCGSFSLVRTGACLTCQDCGTSGGCA